MMNGKLCQARCCRLWQRNLDFQQRLGRYRHTCVAKDVSVAERPEVENLKAAYGNKSS
jgi:hypothetical protein